MKYSCYYIIHLGCFMGFTMHFYITFGTNLLTQSPMPVSVFPLFQCFAEKEYQTESKRNETFGKVIFGKKAILETWSARQGINEESTRQGGAHTPSARPPPSWMARDSFGPTLLLPGLLLVHKKSSKIGTSIGLRFVFLFCKTQKQVKNRNLH